MEVGTGYSTRYNGSSFSKASEVVVSVAGMVGSQPKWAVAAADRAEPHQGTPPEAMPRMRPSWSNATPPPLAVREWH